VKFFSRYRTYLFISLIQTHNTLNTVENLLLLKRSISVSNLLQHIVDTTRDYTFSSIHHTYHVILSLLHLL